MTKNKSKITEVSTTFKNIHRIVLENNLVLDVNEESGPKVGSFLIYEINEKIDENFTGTVMRGHVYKVTNCDTYISFGGLLCKIPEVLHDENKIIFSYLIV